MAAHGNGLGQDIKELLATTINVQIRINSQQLLSHGNVFSTLMAATRERQCCASPPTRVIRHGMLDVTSALPAVRVGSEKGLNVGIVNLVMARLLSPIRGDGLTAEENRNCKGFCFVPEFS